jgi:hypothetical protein
MHEKSEHLKQIGAMTLQELDNELAKIEGRILRHEFQISKHNYNAAKKDTYEIDKWKRAQTLRLIKNKKGGK